MQEKLKRLLCDYVARLKLQRYAYSSIKTYKNALSKFLIAFQDENVSQISVQQIQQYIHTLHNTQKISSSYQKQILASINTFYVLCYDRQLNLSALYPKRLAKPLPKYLTVLEIRNLLYQCTNLKHLCILKILYGCGLRVSEVIALKIDDVDYFSMRLIIRCAKGKKDLQVPLPQSLLLSMSNYYKAYQPKKYLFEGQTREQYSAKSIQTFIKKYAAKAGIKKPVTPHILRHSYATHQLENGINIRHIQEILGHRSIKTTELYTHISGGAKNKVSSPLDLL